MSRSGTPSLRRWSRLALLALLAFPIGSCHSGSGECDSCSSDSDCKSPLVCSSFSDGSKHCGSGIGSTTCRVSRGARGVAGADGSVARPQ